MPLVIGVDESGKGDFFGPLVIGALLAGDDDIPALNELGARDSKVVADQKLLRIDEELRTRFPHAVIIISPEEYNIRYARIKNLNKLLAEGHASAIAQIAAKYKADFAISDQFGKPELIAGELITAGCTLPHKQIVRGEAIPQVAAASMLARAAFLREMIRLSDRFGVKLPLGAGHIVDQAGREAVRKLGPEILSKIAKTHFKNYSRALAGSLF
jgi:ribonuclease HIII